jgi:hypothetical protein
MAIILNPDPRVAQSIEGGGLILLLFVIATKETAVGVLDLEIVLRSRR